MRFDFDPYSELGISPTASTDDVRAAYHRAAKRFHPDHNKNPGAATQIADITAAYELLLDKGKRRDYDEQRGLINETEYYFQFRVTCSKRVVNPLNETQVIYMLAEVLPDPRALESKHKRDSRLNLTLILDHSNSMNGTRLDKVKVAAHQIIDQMQPDDILSIVSFNDRAEVIIEANTVKDKAALKARVSMMTAIGGTEIFQGFEAGIQQNRRFLAPRLVNHVILLTDGHTFGDQEPTISLAKTVATEGIAVSAMGLGQDWNDEFLDQIATVTGGTTSYINSAGGVIRFLNDHVRSLANVFAERVQLSIAPDTDITLESAFKLLPAPQPLSIDTGNIPVGSLQFNRTIAALFQLELPPNLKPGFRTVARFTATGDILTNQQQKYKAINDVSVEISDETRDDNPPTAILEALSKLTLYKMQQRAQEALERGDVKEATRRLENLSTRLIEMGEYELAQQAQAEAQQVAYTNNLSDKGRKTLKYHTRSLLLSGSSQADVE